MAKKTLNEAVVRRFQRLANVAPINETYYSRNDKKYMKEEDDPAMDDAADEPMGDIPEEDPMGGEDKELELTDEEAAGLVQMKPILNSLTDKIINIMPELADGMDDMSAMPAGGEEDEGDEDELETLEEALRGISYVPSRTEVVNEVAKRVARRLQTAKLHEAKLNRALGKRR